MCTRLRAAMKVAICAKCVCETALSEKTRTEEDRLRKELSRGLQKLERAISRFRHSSEGSDSHRLTLRVVRGYFAEESGYQLYSAITDVN